MESEALDLEVAVQCGDIILFSRPCSQMDVVSSFICYSAKFFGWTEWDHLGLVVQNPENLEFYLLEANINGITCHPLQERLQRTKSQKLAVRKLTIQNNRAISTNPESEDSNPEASRRSEKDIFNEFRSELWRLSQLYLNKRYNKSLFQMTDALFSSYSDSFSPSNSVFSLKHQLLLLKEDEFLLRSEMDRRCRLFADSSSSLFTKTINNTLRRQQQKISKLEEEINLADRNTPVSIPPGQPLSDSSRSITSNQDTRSEEYYCSQLVAEIFMEMKILSDHRYSHQYIPADFSSTTMIKGFITHSYDSLVADDVSKLSTEKTHKYLYSPDIIIADKKRLRVAKNDDKDKISLQFSMFPDALKTKDSSVRDKVLSVVAVPTQTSFKIPFHTCDVLPMSVLGNLFVRDDKLTIKVQGDIRIFRRKKIPPTNESEPVYELVTILNSTVSDRINVFELLKTIYLQSIQDYDIFLSAVHSSNLEISASEKATTNIAYGDDVGNNGDVIRQAEVVQRLFENMVHSYTALNTQDTSIFVSSVFNHLRDVLLDQIRPNSSYEEESEIQIELERFRILCGQEIAEIYLNNEKRKQKKENGTKDVHESLMQLLLSLFFLFQDATITKNNSLLFASIDYHLRHAAFSVAQKRDLKDRINGDLNPSSLRDLEDDGGSRSRQLILLPFTATSAISWYGINKIRRNVRWPFPFKYFETKKSFKFASTYLRVMGRGKIFGFLGSMSIASFSVLSLSKMDKKLS